MASTASKPAFPFSPDTQMKSKRVDGQGEFTFPNGNVYRGEFRDGRFHGAGTIHFTHGGRYDAIWDKGLAVSGTYTFKDGLEYVEEPEAWDYCHPAQDRRFYSERIYGFQPGPPQLTNAKEAIPIPLGTLDTGNGYYDPKTQQMHAYSGAVLDLGTRDPTEVDDPKWILSHCRVGER